MTDLCRLSLYSICLSLMAPPGHLLAEASKVTIGLQGHISPKCSLSDMSGQLDFGNTGIGRESRSATVGFTIDCNTPFIYRLSARHGAMLLQGSRKRASNARARLPYRISLTIPTDDGRTLSVDCPGENLSGNLRGNGCYAESGHAVAMNKRGQFAVKMNSPARDQVAGNYRDQIRVNVDVKQ